MDFLRAPETPSVEVGGFWKKAVALRFGPLCTSIKREAESSEVYSCHLPRPSQQKPPPPSKTPTTPLFPISQIPLAPVLQPWVAFGGFTAPTIDPASADPATERPSASKRSADSTGVTIRAAARVEVTRPRFRARSWRASSLAGAGW